MVFRARSAGWSIVVLSLLAVAGCGDDDGSGSDGPAGGAAVGGDGQGNTASGGQAQGGAGQGGASLGGGSQGGQGGSAQGGAGVGGASAVVCDYQVDNGLMVIEAEDLPLPADWEEQSTFAGFTGSGYRVWTGNSQNNNPGQGLVAVEIYIPAAGRYRVQWHNRIGMGTNTTEHNDTWLRFADVDGYYGLKVNNQGEETRRYPKPLCDDNAAMAAIEADPDVTEATCPNGTTKDGWLKVYSSGANDWKWSTFTSDNDAHGIYIEVAQAGVYTMELSARGDFHLLDRIVVHEESLDNNAATDLAATVTPCP